MVDWSGLNGACLSSFGQALTFTPASTGVDQSVNGILDTAAEPETDAPGDGTIYARLWLKAPDPDPAPEPGDEISTSTTVYKIVRLERDAGGGLWLLLRQDRSV